MEGRRGRHAPSEGSVAPSSNQIPSTSVGLPVPGLGSPGLAPASGDGATACFWFALWAGVGACPVEPNEQGSEPGSGGVSRLLLER